MWPLYERTQLLDIKRMLNLYFVTCLMLWIHWKLETTQGNKSFSKIGYIFLRYVKIHSRSSLTRLQCYKINFLFHTTMTKKNSRKCLVTTSKLQDGIFWIISNQLSLIIFNRMKAKWKDCPSKTPLTQKHCFILGFQGFALLSSLKCNTGNLKNGMIARRLKCLEMNFYSNILAL